MKCYVLVFPRPIGVEPTIYFTKPDLGDPDDPFTPDIIDFENEVDAARYIKNYLGHLYQDALNDYNNGKLKIVP